MTIDYNAAVDLLQRHGAYDPERGSNDRRLAAVLRRYTGSSNRLVNYPDVDSMPTVRDFEEKNPDWTGLLITVNYKIEWHGVAMYRGKTYNSRKSDFIAGKMALDKFDRPLAEVDHLDLLWLFGNETVTSR